MMIRAHGEVVKGVLAYTAGTPMHFCAQVQGQNVRGQQDAAMTWVSMWFLLLL
jgi:hypothetical protein